MSVMRTVVFCCIFLVLLFFLSVSALPARDRRTVRQLQVSPTRKLQGWRRSNGAAGLEKMGGRRTLHPEGCVQSALTARNESEVLKRWRCGVPDPPGFLQPDRSRRQRRKRFALFGGRWEKNLLTYKIMRFPQQMSEDKIRRIFQEAFGVWSAVTPLRFREVIDEKADIIIDFNRYWHGDDLPFDGPGGILAHAYFPRTHREGEVHFDYDESWTVGNSVGTDLLHVAAHEFGHVLGLQHSLEPDAVMCPFYSDEYPLRLSEDDKRGIQYLYGPPQHTPPEITETNEINIEVPDACRTNFDAVSMIRGELFFFKSQYVWRIRDGQLEAGYPALSSRHWRGIPDHVDAAYEDKSGNIWFFQGDSYWVFDAERKITGPDSVQKLGLPVSDIQAALKWEKDHVEKVYLFKTYSYWTFNVRENRVDDVHPRSIHELVGVPGHLDGAFLDKYGYANFLSGLYYWRFDPVGLKVLDGFPRTIGMDFFGCSASLYK